ncbi:PREDICTED: uncharacterized protein LOC103925557 [Pygoscelis adeliae]|uniref:uncharacterized protein LOC103925557 n=1 Tax=Pygoscelis adeliae TaxID=9238 RepID=UPI0004F4F3AC|nr:PREDICTED: uncharacterized protein LOC103925557 [Pygoscelis adeliae]
MGIGISDEKLREDVNNCSLFLQKKKQTELVFRDLPTAVVTSENDVGYTEKNYTTRNFQRTRLSLHLVILIAVACGAVVFLVIFFIICIRKPKDAQVYEVKFHNSRAAASSGCKSTDYYEEPISSTENNYVMEAMKDKSSEEINTKKDEYDCVGNTQESVYENVLKNQGLGNFDFKMEREQTAALVGDDVLEKSVNMYMQLIANVEKQMKIIKLQDCKREIVDFTLDDETPLKVLGKLKCHQSDRDTQ